MKGKGIFFGMVFLLGLTGCAARPVEKPLPTLAPTLEENAGSELSGGSKEPEEKEKSSGVGGLGVDFIRYVEKSKVAKDENLVATLKTAIEVACYDYMSDGTKLPEEPICFRYTHELDELDDAYSSLKEIIREIVGDNEIVLSDEDCYMMVEISRKENGAPEVKVEIMQK